MNYQKWFPYPNPRQTVFPTQITFLPAFPEPKATIVKQCYLSITKPSQSRFTWASREQYQINTLFLHHEIAKGVKNIDIVTRPTLKAPSEKIKAKNLFLTLKKYNQRKYILMSNRIRLTMYVSCDHSIMFFVRYTIIDSIK